MHPLSDVEPTRQDGSGDEELDMAQGEAGPTMPVAGVRRIDGHDVGVEVLGSGSVLVLLHGLGRDRSDWIRVLPGLATRHRVVAVDLEGFGASEVWGEQVSLASMAELVRRTVREVAGDQPFGVIGNSMGGAVAMRLAADDPASVTALVLVGSAGFGAEANFGLRLMTVPLLGHAILRTGRAGAFVQVRSLFADKRLATRELMDAFATSMRRPRAVQTHLDVVHELGAWRGVRPEWRDGLLAVLAEAGIPSLVLWGEDDAVLPSRHLAGAAAAFPHATTRLLPGVGHMPQLEDPEGFVEVVLEFLSDVAGS